MTGNDAPASPPYPVELLADLHAGAIDADQAARLWPLVRADARAAAVLAALDATRAQLSALAPPPMPAEVAARIDAALRAEVAARSTATPGATVLDLGSRTPTWAKASRISSLSARRRRVLLASAALLTAAAAVFGVVVVTGLTGEQTSGSAVASSTGMSDQALPPLALSGDNLATALQDGLAAADYGPLGGQGRLDACLAANAVDPAVVPLGAREVELDGTRGVLLVLPTGTAGRLRLLVVAPDCGAGRAATLADITVGR